MTRAFWLGMCQLPVVRPPARVPTNRTRSASNTSWHTWAIVSNSTSSKFYIDGGAANASADSGPNGFSSNTMELGGVNGSTLPLNGFVTDVLMYSGALTTTQIDTVTNCIAGLRGICWTPSQ